MWNPIRLDIAIGWRLSVEVGDLVQWKDHARTGLGFVVAVEPPGAFRDIKISWVTICSSLGASGERRTWAGAKWCRAAWVEVVNESG